MSRDFLFSVNFLEYMMMNLWLKGLRLKVGVWSLLNVIELKARFKKEKCKPTQILSLLFEKEETPLRILFHRMLAGYIVLVVFIDSQSFVHTLMNHDVDANLITEIKTGN